MLTPDDKQKPPTITQLKELDRLVVRADESTINWLYSHYNLAEELANAYDTSVVISYFEYYDGKRRDRNNQWKGIDGTS